MAFRNFFKRSFDSYGTIFFGIIGVMSVFVLHLSMIRGSFSEESRYLFDSSSSVEFLFDISLVIAFNSLFYRIMYPISREYIRISDDKSIKLKFLIGYILFSIVIIWQYVKNSNQSDYFFSNINISMFIMLVALIFIALIFINMEIISDEIEINDDYNQEIDLVKILNLKKMVDEFKQEYLVRSSVINSIVGIVFVLSAGLGQLKALSLLAREPVKICVNDSVLEAVPLFRSAGGWVYADANVARTLPSREVPVFFLSFEAAEIVADSENAEVISRVCGVGVSDNSKPIGQSRSPDLLPQSRHP